MIRIDHNVVMQMWQDPLIWEKIPVLEPYREDAEMFAAEAVAANTSLKVKHSWLYSRWLEIFQNWLQDDLHSLDQLVKYIQEKRKNTNESILLPAHGMYIDLSLIEGANNGPSSTT
jgi:hypothetical protein